MRVENRDGKRVQKLLIGLITSKEVVGAVASRWESPGLFEASWANLIAHWAIRYYQKFQKPIGQEIETKFYEWCESRKTNKETIQAIENLLANLDREFRKQEPTNAPYLIDLAGEIFTATLTRRAIEQAELLLGEGKAVEATEALQQLRAVPLGQGRWTSPCVDYGCWEGLFEHEEPRDLFRYRGALRTLTRGSFGRGHFVAWMGKDKVGKSFVLQDAALRAIKARCKVAYFEVGDLSEEEVKIRLAENACKLPQHISSLYLPKIITDKETVFETVNYNQVLSSQVAFRTIRKLARGMERLRLSCHPAQTLDVEGLDNILQEWERDGWVADVVVIDYADILAPPRFVKDSLEQIDKIWVGLRRLSQQRHCLVLTATQANAGSYNSHQLLSRRNFSGRKTKLAHVTAMLGLNDFPFEHEQVIRWNWIVRRHGRPFAGSAVRVAGCLGLSSPVMRSAMLSDGESKNVGVLRDDPEDDSDDGD